MKVCRTCKIKKPLADYNKNKRQKDGFAKICRDCDKAYNSKWYAEKHPQEILPENHKRCTRCKEVKPLTSYYRRKKINVQPHCKTCEVKIYQEWKDTVGKEWERQYVKQRKEQDPLYKLRFLLRLRLLDALKRQLRGGKVTKQHSAIGLVGCTMEELKIHLENQFITGMTWDNHGEVWEIDHIRPCTWFNLTNIDEQKACFNYKNLQPLFKTTTIVNGIEYIGNRNKRNLSEHRQG